MTNIKKIRCIGFLGFLLGFLIFCNQVFATDFQYVAPENIKELDVGAAVKTQGIVIVEPGILGAQVFYINGVQIYSYYKDFPKLKRNMIWPTAGYVISHFGRHKHPKWKTITENIGIDIKAEFGQDVRAVANGIVTAITWQRGRGNIVIINHLGGYFSVYTHLSQIIVQIDQKIQIGQVIGNVGDTGSLQGPMLHFEIWKGTTKQNPAYWIVKK